MDRLNEPKKEMHKSGEQEIRHILIGDIPKWFTFIFCDQHFFIPNFYLKYVGNIIIRPEEN